MADGRVKHQDPHPRSGEVVRLKEGIEHPQYEIAGAEFMIEDWWDHLTGGSWMFADGNPACMIYAMRGMGLPIDDEVVYGKIGSMGVLVHVSEIEDDDGEADEV
jgi:hypothetical protein